MTGADGRGERRSSPLGPVVSFPCDVRPGDRIGVRLVGIAKTLGARVAIGAEEMGRFASAILTPADARSFAAAILNAADEADGTRPLRFYPPTPDGVEPDQS